MPSPYGSKRSANSYYQHAAVAQHYNYNWDGIPPGPTRAAETRGLGCLGCDEDYVDITATFHKSLGSLGDYPVSMSMEGGRKSVLHSGPEQTRIYDAMGIFGLSDNENRLALIAGLGLAGYIAWKMLGKKR